MNSSKRPAPPAPVQDLSCDEQWLRDLETLERIERQREDAEGCFFCDMADVMAGRAPG